jgi:hypothetical protein
MTISTTLTPLVQYNGNGVTTAFNTSFVFIASADLTVTLTNTSGVDTVLTLSTHYTVSGGSGASGTVTMITPPATGEKLTIQRTTPKKQEVDYIENNAFPAASHELALDRLTLITQELDEKVGRSLVLSPTGGLSGIEIPVQADEFIKWNALGTNLETVTISALGAVAFAGNGILAYTGSTTLQNRSITGTTNEITIVNGNGVSGNPVISLPTTMVLTAKDVSVGASNFKIRDTTDTTKIATFSASGITTATTRTYTLPNASGTIALTSDVSPSGSIAQVVSATLTTTLTTTSATYADATGLSVNITPSSTSSRIFITCDVNAGANSGTAPIVQLVRGSTPLAIGTSIGSRTPASANETPQSAAGMVSMGFSIVDSPATTSSTTYKIQFATLIGGTASYINRTHTDTDATGFCRTASTITVMEIK